MEGYFHMIFFDHIPKTSAFNYWIQ